MMPLQVSGQTSSEANSKFAGQLDTQASGGTGNRGFINNFAARGGSVSAPEINGPAWQPNPWLLVGGAVAVLLGLLIWAKYGHR